MVVVLCWTQLRGTVQDNPVSQSISYHSTITFAPYSCCSEALQENWWASSKSVLISAILLCIALMPGTAPRGKTFDNYTTASSFQFLAVLRISASSYSTNTIRTKQTHRHS